MFDTGMHVKYRPTMNKLPQHLWSTDTRNS